MFEFNSINSNKIFTNNKTGIISKAQKYKNIYNIENPFRKKLIIVLIILRKYNPKLRNIAKYMRYFFISISAKKIVEIKIRNTIPANFTKIET